MPEIVDDEVVTVAPGPQVNSFVGGKPVVNEGLVNEVPAHPRIGGDTKGVEGQIFTEGLPESGFELERIIRGYWALSRQNCDCLIARSIH
jgi:hypothetical protein